MLTFTCLLQYLDVLVVNIFEEKNTRLMIKKKYALLPYQIHFIKQSFVKARAFYCRHLSVPMLRDLQLPTHARIVRRGKIFINDR